MLSFFDESTSSPMTLGASSITTLATGFRSNVPLALEFLYSSNSFDAMILPINNSASSPSLDVSKTTTLPASTSLAISFTVVRPFVVASNTSLLEIKLLSSSMFRPIINLNFLLTTKIDISWNSWVVNSSIGVVNSAVIQFSRCIR